MATAASAAPSARAPVPPPPSAMSAPARMAEPPVQPAHVQPMPVQAVPAAMDAESGDAPGLDDLPPWDAFEDIPERVSAQVLDAAVVQSLPVRDTAPTVSAVPSRTEVLKRPEAPLQPTPEDHRLPIERLRLAKAHRG